jgi:glyoxylase-like metal-dependent hydrolase (beta-lactamase superfamily II)
MMKKLCLALGLLMAGGVGAEDRLFTEAWNNGTAPEPEMQVQRIDRDSFVIRQSIRTNFEGPFLFLLFGQQKALLIDSGAGGLKIRPTIDRIIAEWRSETNHGPIALIVAHSHGHGDHIAGDVEFQNDPAVSLVGTKPEQVAQFFHLANWPLQTGMIDLGGRPITLIPSPGHEAAELSYFDARTGILLTGDFLYPGRLYCGPDNFEDYRKSVDRVVAATKDKKVRWILGNHIEMTATPRRDYAMHANDHPNEHRLELPYDELLELQDSLAQMGPRPRLDVHLDFIFYPVP